MGAANEEMTITYAGVTVGSSSARKISDYTREDHGYVNGAFEFEFVTTAASDAALVSELSTLRTAFQTPRGDLVVTQNGQTYLSRKHSANTGLNTNPTIVKDGDPADTGRSHHFRIRIEYELPADKVATSFRRGATITVQYTPERRRTVTITGIYTANSTDGTTTASAQYLAQIATYETAELANIAAPSPTLSWERVGQTMGPYFETNKTVEFTRIYREVNINQAIGTLDDADIIDPHLEITVEQTAADDSYDQLLALANFGGGTGDTIAAPSAPTGESVAGSIKRPIIITANYDAGINFETTIDLQGKWESTIRPWIRARAKLLNPMGVFVQIHEDPAYEDYENHIRGSMTFMSFSGTIIKAKMNYRDLTADGKVLTATSEKDPFSYYEYQGPAVRQMTVTEEYEELVSPASSARMYVLSKYAGVGGGAAAFGSDWVKVSRTSQAYILTKGFFNNTKQGVAYATLETVLQFRHKKTPSKANAGGVTGGTVTG